MVEDWVDDITPTVEGEWLVGAERGLFRYTSEGLVQVPDGSEDEIGWVDDIIPTVEGEWLVGAERGLFRYTSEGLVQVPDGSEDEIGWVDDIIPTVEGEWLVGAERGLFRYTSEGLVQVPDGSGNEIGGVGHITPTVEGEWLVETGRGLFRYTSEGLVQVPDGSGNEIGSIRDITPTVEGEWLVETGRGLFHYTSEGLVQVPDGSEDEIGGVGDIIPTVEGEWLVGAERGLFHYTSEGLVQVPDGSGNEIGRVDDITPTVEGEWLVGAERGLFRYTSEGLVQVPDGSEDEIGGVGHITPTVEGEWLVGAERGLFRYTSEGLVQVPDGSGNEMGPVFGITPTVEGEWLIEVYRGLFRYTSEGLVQAPDGSTIEIGSVDDITPTVEGEWLVGAEHGLFLARSYVRPQVIETPDRNIQNGEGVRLEWRLTSPCDRTYPQRGLFQIALGADDDPTRLGTWKSPGLSDRNFERGFQVETEDRIIVPGEDRDVVEAALLFRPSEDAEWEEIPGSRVELRIAWGWRDHALHQAAVLGPWALAIHAALFAGLLAAARRFAWPWRVMTDRALNKAFMWFWLALRHVPPLQRIVLARWFDATARRVEQQPFVPLPVTGPDEESRPSTELMSLLRPGCRLWLVGEPGMGKTALVEHLAARYFGGPDDARDWTLARAYRRHRCILLPIALREFAHTPVPTAPENWLFDLAERAVAAAGVPIDDHALLRGMIADGGFVLVLDGANEVDDHGAIQQFALRYPGVGLLVTSQVRPEAEARRLFETWHLPPDIGDAVAPLLKLWLGAERGAATACAVERSPIRADLRSGYDLRLIADLVEGGVAPDALPDTRTGLYEAILERAGAAAGAPHLATDLSRIAWRMWLEGRRHIVEEDARAPGLLDAVTGDGARVARTRDGRVHEFRHDEMRGYLAARWVARETVSPLALLEDTPEVWRLPRSEQRVVWGFFADLVSPQDGGAVLEWAAEDERRAALQVSLRWIARRDRWPNPPRVAAV